MNGKITQEIPVSIFKPISASVRLLEEPIVEIAWVFMGCFVIPVIGFTQLLQHERKNYPEIPVSIFNPISVSVRLFEKPIVEVAWVFMGCFVIPVIGFTQLLRHERKNYPRNTG